MNYKQARHQLIRHRAKEQLAAHFFEPSSREVTPATKEKPKRFAPRPVDPEQIEKVAWFTKANAEHEGHKLDFVEC